MTLPVGTIAFQEAVTPPHGVRGVTYSDTELETALGYVKPLIWDEAGTTAIANALTGVSTTAFATENLKAALAPRPLAEHEAWRVGESIAEAYLTEKHACEFPWPTGRDLRNPNASPAGTDLVGFQPHNGSVRFAFGEVKTSSDPETPPGVWDGRHGLKHQLEELRDGSGVKNALMKYLGHHAINAPWFEKWKEAARRFLREPADVSLFGIMIRDIVPAQADVTRGKKLCVGCPPPTALLMVAIYLPPKAIAKLVKRMNELGGVA